MQILAHCIRPLRLFLSALVLLALSSTLLSAQEQRQELRLAQSRDMQFERECQRAADNCAAQCRLPAINSRWGGESQCWPDYAACKSGCR